MTGGFAFFQNFLINHADDRIFCILHNFFRIDDRMLCIFPQFLFCQSKSYNFKIKTQVFSFLIVQDSVEMMLYSIIKLKKVVY